MSRFDERENAFEAKFAHELEQAYRARARAIRALGLWAAEKRGDTGAQAEAYARALVDTDIISGPEATIECLVRDLAPLGIDQAEIELKCDALSAAHGS